VRPSSASSGEFDLFADLRKELDELSAANREILSELRSDPSLNLDSTRPSHADEAAWTEREQTYQAALAEKDEAIRKLEKELQDIHDHGLPQVELTDEQIHDAVLKRLRRQLEERSQQLAEDEEALMTQTREMELSLAKDRAEMARQRSELQRLHADFQRELEHATSRDSNLRDRLVTIQRRHIESQTKRAATDPGLTQAAALHAAADAPAQSAKPAGAKQNSGLLRRLFG
jgi:hypothetical protein